MSREPASTPHRARHRGLRALFAGCIVVALCAQSYGPSELDAAFEREPLVISATAFACYRFDVWIARTREQQTRGLMFVRDLPERAGMLFVYRQPAGRSMWMKNTYIPLDMLFIRADGSVSTVVSDTEPLSLRSIGSIEPVTFVLELNAGLAAELHIGSGARVYWSDDR